jgi:hypothetical protein
MTKSSPLSLDLIAQHCTLLPPELVALTPHHTIAATHYITQDQITENIQEIDPVIQL